MAVCGKLGSALVYIFLKKINFCQNSCAYSRAFILQGFLETTGKIISLDNFGIFWYVKVGEVTFCQLSHSNDDKTQKYIH